MKIHFIGIGGVGLSGLAKHLHHEGHKISGSDIWITGITKELEVLGIHIDVPHSADWITDQELVIYSAVIKLNNPEIVRAKELGIKVASRSEALHFILEDKRVFAVAGAHGKSTTSAMLASVINGSMIIGAYAKSFGSNERYVDNDIMVFEADESDASFLNANAHYAIVTNAELEHMEFYEYDEERFYDAYHTFLSRAKVRIINAEDPYLKSLDHIDAIRLYPSKDITNIKYTLIDDEPFTEFTLKGMGIFKVWGFGKHIAVDASLAILASLNEVGLHDIKEKLLGFRGIKKRFDIIYKGLHNVVIDDYGHHPTEIKATMDSVVEYKRLKNFKTITAIWQPHKYSRTIDNLDAFKKCFKGVDKLIILPVWSAGEEFVDIDFFNEFKHYNLNLAISIKRNGKKVLAVEAKDKYYELEEDIVISFGAGDITYQIRGQKA